MFWHLGGNIFVCILFFNVCDLHYNCLLTAEKERSFLYREMRNTFHPTLQTPPAEYHLFLIAVSVPVGCQSSFCWPHLIPPGGTVHPSVIQLTSHKHKFELWKSTYTEISLKKYTVNSLCPRFHIPCQMQQNDWIHCFRPLSKRDLSIHRSQYLQRFLEPNPMHPAHALW